MLSDPLLRPATRSDIPALHRLVEHGYRPVKTLYGIEEERITVEELLAIVDDPAQVILVAEKRGELVACVQISAMGDGMCYLELLCVEPPRQAEGLGKRLLAAAERKAVVRFGATRIEMTVIERRTELIAYYGRRGYAPTGEKRPFPVESVRLPLVVLAKNIASALVHGGG
jgi:GNAT superfamily N-acetyltransferase